MANQVRNANTPDAKGFILSVLEHATTFALVHMALYDCVKSSLEVAHGHFAESLQTPAS